MNFIKPVYVFDDGGREDAGYKGHTGDCVTEHAGAIYDMLGDDLDGAASMMEDVKGWMGDV